jgi:hypothetical protein
MKPYRRYRQAYRQLFTAYYQMALAGHPCLHCAVWYQSRLAQ